MTSVAATTTTTSPPMEIDEHYSDDDDDSSIMSQLSQLSNSIYRQFAWMQNGSSLLDPTDLSGDDDDEAEEKQLDIIYCLNGTLEQVDLWHLRDLSIARGGLVSSSMRKRAWPKLVGAHVEILHPQGTLVPVSNSSIRLLQKDVLQTSWNVHDYMTIMKRQEEEVKMMKLSSRGNTAVTMVGTPRNKSKQSKRVKEEQTTATSPLPDLAPATSGEDDDGVLLAKQQQQETTTTTTTAQDAASVDASTLDDDASSHASTNTGTNPSLQTAKTPSPHSSPRRRMNNNNNRNRSEQKVLFNIIVTVLRMPPLASPYFEDDRYKMFSGMTDLAALLLINLESPSLTSLVLGRLGACSSLRDSLRSPKARTMESAVELCLFPLLQNVDLELYQHIGNNTIILSTTLVPWITCWCCPLFPNDVTVASRLLDVFIASHPIMPLYFCVAYLTHHRTMLLSSMNSNPKEMKKTIQKLPSTTPAITMNVLEDLIEISLSYLSHYPPSSTNHDDNTTNTTRRGDIHMMQPVEWASSAPTDYALLQQAKAQRMSGRKTSSTSRDVQSTLPEKSNADIKLFYPKAYVATGQVAARRSLQRKQSGKMRLLILLSLLLSILLLVVVLWNNNHDGPVLMNTMRRLFQAKRRGGGFNSKKTTTTVPSAAVAPTIASRMESPKRPPTEESKRQAAAAAERARAEAKAAAAEKVRFEAKAAAAAEKARAEARAAAEKARAEAKATAAAERARLEAKLSAARAKAAAAEREAAAAVEKQEARQSRSRNSLESPTNSFIAPSPAPILATAFQPSIVQQKLSEKKKLHQRPKGKPQPFRDFLTAIGRFFSKLFGVKLLSS